MRLRNTIYKIFSVNLTKDAKTNSTERNSNVELLRLICMLMILIHHLITHCLYGIDFVFYGVGSVSFVSAIAIMINGLCYVGVNCFLLISGYFGLRFRWKTLFKLYFIMVFYSFIYDLFDMYIRGEIFDIHYLLDNILTMSGFSRWWFMECYIIFFFIAPLIKVEGWSKIQYQKIILLLTIVNIYLAYWHNRYSNGYTVAQFLYMYIIGAYIRRFIDVDKLHKSLMFLLYFLPGILFGVISVVSHYKYLPHWEALAYNNPLNVVSAIGLFCFILTFKFHSKLINFISASALSIYLIQHYAFMNKIVCFFTKWLLYGDKCLVLLFILSIVSFGYFFVAIIVDQVRKMVYALILLVYSRIIKYE